MASHAGWRARVVAYGAPTGWSARGRERVCQREWRAGGRPELAPLGLGWPDEARVRHRRAGVPALGRAPALDRPVEDPEAICAILAGSRCRGSGPIARAPRRGTPATGLRSAP